MVLHDQTNDMQPFFQKLDYSLAETVLQRNFVHMGPLIRRESEYTALSVEERR